MIDFPFFDRGADHLNLIQATSEIGIWELDAATGKAMRNLRHDQIFGHDSQLDDWSAEIFLSYVEEDDRERIGTMLDTSLREGTRWSFETRIRRADGIDRWISANGMPILSDAGKVTKLIGHVIDITETKRNEDRLRLLSTELNHRVVNTFTIMNSMIRQIAKKTDSVDDFAETLLHRLAALSRANRVLVAEEAGRSSLRAILDMELAAFEGWRTRINISGNLNVWFSPKASEALAMILHELLTNAIKHGALSQATGDVNVSVTHGPERQVTVRWTETGGPVLTAERRTGIGSTILQNALHDEGRVTMDFAASGLRCDITVFDSVRHESSGETTVDPITLPVDSAIDPSDVLNGRKLLVVEDDPIIGMDLADIFQSRGMIVIGPFTTVADALKALAEKPDAALIDVNLVHETSTAVAEKLVDLSIPFCVLSGQMDSAHLGAAFQDVTIVPKPFRETELLRQVTALLV